MDLLDLVVKISAEDNASDKVEKTSSNITDKLKNVATVGAGVVTAVTGVGIATATAFASSAGKVAEYGDSIDKASQKIGISAEAYQEWDFIAQHSGTSMDALKGSFKTLAKQAQSGSETFEKLGISLEDVGNMSTEDLFSSVVAGLQNMEEGTERTTIASELLGKGALELGALFNTSAEDTAAMKEQVHALGGVMSNDAIKASAQYQDSLQNMQVAFAGIKNNVMSNFLPAMSSVMDGIAMVFSGDSGGSAKIAEGIQGFADTMIDALPVVVDAAASIIDGLLTAFIDNLPKIIEVGIEVIVQLIAGIASALPKLIEHAPEIIGAVVTGIVNAFPVLANSVTQLVNVIIQTITNLKNIILQKGKDIVDWIRNAITQKFADAIATAKTLIDRILGGITQKFSEIIAKGKETVDKIIEGIKEKFSELVESGQEIINQVKEGVLNVIEDAKTWGRDLINNFIGGIKEKWNDLTETVSGVADTIKDFIGFSEPEKGPLSRFHTFAPDMMQLFAQGINENKRLITDAISDSFDLAPVIAGATGQNNSVSVTQNIYSKAQTASELMREARWEQERAVLMGV